MKLPKRAFWFLQPITVDCNLHFLVLENRKPALEESKITAAAAMDHNQFTSISIIGSLPSIQFEFSVFRGDHMVSCRATTTLSADAMEF